MLVKNWKRNISLFMFAQTVSLLGSSLVQYAIIWYITLATSSGKILMVATICGFIPQIIISLFAGVWVDRYNRKKIIMISDAVIACATFILAITFASGSENLWILFIVLIIRSAGSGIQGPAVNAVIPQIVPKEYLLKINGINGTLSSAMLFISPIASGAILMSTSFENVLFIDVITAIIGISITSFIWLRPYKHNEDEKLITVNEIKKGFQYVKDNSFLKNILLFQVTTFFLISTSALLTPLFVSRIFGKNVLYLTISEASYSLGMIIGGIIISVWGGFKTKIHTTLLSIIIYALMVIGIGLFASSLWIYVILTAIIGITSSCYYSPLISILQESVDESMQGRIFSFMQISASCAFPLGMLVFGPLADVVPIQYLFIFGGVGILIITGYFYLSGRLVVKK